MAVDQEQENWYEVSSSRMLQQASEAHYSAADEPKYRYEMAYAISSAFVSAIHDLADAIRSVGPREPRE